MLRVLNLLEGDRILDIGCYTGEFARAAIDKRPNATLVAVDYDSENLRIARTLYPEMAAAFRQMSVYELAFPDASVDCVTFQEVIEHLEGAALAIKEINRVLTIGGCLVVTTPNAYYWRDARAFVASEFRNLVRPRNRRALSDATFEARTEWNRHILCWTPSTLLTLLKGNGFQYEFHAYAVDASTRLERALLRAIPFLGPVVVLKVRKVADAPTRLI
jgi:ubiquinone/menaquinone biosynthesis C-methylase UbiE